MTWPEFAKKRAVRERPSKDRSGQPKEILADLFRPNAQCEIAKRKMSLRIPATII